MSKMHWTPMGEVSWRSGPRARVYHSGRTPVCGISRGSMNGVVGPVVGPYSLATGIDCSRCLAILAKARTEHDKLPVIGCQVHADCVAHPDLGRACRAEDFS